MLEKPDKLTLYRNIEDGGLGLIDIQTRARAALLSTFLQTAIGKNFTSNHYHNYLYRHYALGENFQRPDIPPNFSGDFFPTIRRLKDSGLNMEECTLKQIYIFLMKDTLSENDNNNTDDSLIPLKRKKTWGLVRSKGLGPELTSFTLTLLWGITPT